MVLGLLQTTNHFYNQGGLSAKRSQENAPANNLFCKVAVYSTSAKPQITRVFPGNGYDKILFEYADSNLFRQTH